MADIFVWLYLKLRKTYRHNALTYGMSLGTELSRVHKLGKLCADETVANGSQVCWIDGFVIVDYNDFSARINDEKTGKLYWVQRKHTQKVKIRPSHLEDDLDEDYQSEDIVNEAKFEIENGAFID